MILANFNCTIDKKGRDGGNKTQRLYRCGSNYALSKIIMDNELEDLWEGRTKILLKSSTTTDPLALDPQQRGSILIQKLLAIPRPIT